MDISYRRLHRRLQRKMFYDSNDYVRAAWHGLKCWLLCVRELISVMHADTYKMVPTVSLSARHPSTPMLVASACHVTQTVQNPRVVPDRSTLSDPEHVTRVRWYSLMTSTVYRQRAVCQPTLSAALVSTADQFLQSCVVQASENWQVLLDAKFAR